MLTLSPQSRVFLALAPVDFRRGIDALAAVCRQHLGHNPLDGAVYGFRNRRATAIRLLLYDGQGYWLCTKRLSQGRFQWWPQAPGASVELAARELAILLWNGNPEQARMAEDWPAGWPNSGWGGPGSSRAATLGGSETPHGDGSATPPDTPAH